MDKLSLAQKVTYPYIEKMYWMHGIRIAPLTVAVKGKEVTLPRWLSGNGDSIRLFPTKKQAEDVMKYYTELLLEKEKKVEEMQENAQPIQAVVWAAEPEQESQVDWPLPEGYDETKVTGKIWTGQWVDESVAAEAAAMAGEHMNVNQPEVWTPPQKQAE